MLDFLPDWLVGDVKNMTWRDALYQFLNFGMIVSSALMIWKGLICFSGCESPVVVVLSGSMEPAFYRGDLLFLSHYRETPLEMGEIVVFRLNGRDIPIVHRLIKYHENTETGEIKYLTKGDNNNIDDRGLYNPGQKWITPPEIIGRARGTVPYIGYVTILLNDYPKLKYAVLGILACCLLFKKDTE